MLMAVVVGGFWSSSLMKKSELSKDEEGIMKRYMDIMARKNVADGGNAADVEGKEEDRDGEADEEDLDVRRSYANSIAEIYSPKWAPSEAEAGSPHSGTMKKGNFVPYVASAEGANPSLRHMSIQMTTFSKRESTRLGGAVVEAPPEVTTVPVREYSFNPMNVSNNNTVTASRRTSTNALTAHRRASAAVTQSHVAPSPEDPSSSADLPSQLQSRRATTNVSGILGMNMQLAGRSGALVSNGNSRRISMVPPTTGPIPGTGEYAGGVFGGVPLHGLVENDELLEAPVAPIAPSRKSAFQKEARAGPARFTLK